jgi:hypothetical protein
MPRRLAPGRRPPNKRRPGWPPSEGSQLVPRRDFPGWFPPEGRAGPRAFLVCRSTEAAECHQLSGKFFGEFSGGEFSGGGSSGTTGRPARPGRRTAPLGTGEHGPPVLAHAPPDHRGRHRGAHDPARPRWLDGRAGRDAPRPALAGRRPASDQRPRPAAARDSRHGSPLLRSGYPQHRRLGGVGRAAPVRPDVPVPPVSRGGPARPNPGRLTNHTGGPRPPGGREPARTAADWRGKNPNPGV